MTADAGSVPRRHFSDAEGAVDPLLCEEDTHAIFRQWNENEFSLAAALRALAGCSPAIVLPGIIVTYLRFGPPRLGWFASIALSVVGAIIVAWVWARLKLAISGRVHELERRTGSEGGGDSWDDWEEGPPYTKCGASGRELAVARYLVAARGDISEWVLVVAVAALVIATSVGAIHVAGHAWLKWLVVVSGACVIHAFHRSRRELIFADRVHGWLEGRGLLLAKQFNVLDLAPSGVLPGGARARTLFIRPGLLVLNGWIGTYLLVMAYFGIRGTGLGPHAAFLYAASLLGISILVHRRRERLLAETRERQAAWLHFLSLADNVLGVREDDPTPDADRWARWILSPDRDPKAPCPEQDARWMARQGGLQELLKFRASM